VSEDILYLMSVIGSLIALGAIVVASWAVIEGAYWLYCKIRGKDY
jgi:hypothetical protein